MLTLLRPIAFVITLVCATTAWSGAERCGAATDETQSNTDPGDFILLWQVAGPFASEQMPDSPSTLWRDVQPTNSAQTGWIDLTAPGECSYCSVYARTQLWSDVEQAIQLELNSTNKIMFSLNDEEILSNDQGIARATLNQGWNTLLLKVYQDDSEWGFACRLLDSSGSSLSRVRVDPLARSLATPSDAVVLFDGSDVSAWRHEDGSDLGWRVEQGGLVVEPGAGDAFSRETFEDFTLHLEFMYPETDPADTGDGNSGIYIFDTYEVQILDSHDQPARDNGCGALYRFRAPDVNVAYRPGQWQRYDIEFVAPRWDENGTKLAQARITVRHNGVLVHRDIRLTRPTGAGSPERPGGGPIVLQDHGNRVRYRNIWVVPQTSWEGPNAAGFKPLFDGETLNGWRRIGGKAVYVAQDGMIVGETRPNQPNTFLCTEQNYADYVLELEFKVDRQLNSGIQIRSWSDSNDDDSRVRGYQVEIDPSDRAWSAGIYEEGRRGWLHKLDNNELAQLALNPDIWNRLRISARGDVIRTYLNDVPASVLLDGSVRTGFIGLQVHGVGDRTEPLRIRWRDIRLKTIK